MPKSGLSAELRGLTIVHVQVERRGGLAGIALRGEADTSELEPSRQQAAEAALSSMTDGKAPAEPGHPDGFQYEIGFSEPGGRRRSVVLDEWQVTPDLQPLLDLAMAHGKLV